MKKIALLVLVLCSFVVNAQDCKNYYFLQNNKTIEMTMTDKKGSASGKFIYTVSNAKSTGSSATATVNSEVFDKKGKVIGKGATEMKCSNGVLMMDMKMSIPQQQAEQFSKAERRPRKTFIWNTLPI